MGPRFQFRDQSSDALTFTDWLTRLKSRGSNLLVTGDVPEDVSATFSRTLFGRGLRKRVLALVAPTARSPADHLPESATLNEDAVSVVDCRGYVRSVTAEESGGQELPQSELTACQTDLVSTVERYDDAADGLDSAKLRLGIDSIGVLAAHTDEDALEQFVRGLTESVYDVSGMGHYHCRRPDDDPLVETLSPLFDARIELRRRPGRIDQRWHVPERNRTTSWVELS